MARQRRGQGGGQPGTTPPGGENVPGVLGQGLEQLQRQAAALAEVELRQLAPAQEQLLQGMTRLAQGTELLRQAQLGQARALAAGVPAWQALALSQTTLAAGVVAVTRSLRDATAATGLLTEGGRQLLLSTTGLTLAYGLATGAVLGYTRAGLAGTVQGERLAWAQQQLSRQIASVFLPAVELLTRGLERLTDWFRQLDGAQQAHIRRWAEAAVGMLGVVVVVPRLVAGLATLRTALVALSVGNPLLGISAGMVGLLSVTDRGRERLAELGSRLAEALTPAAEALANVLLPGVEALSNLLSTAAGQWVLFGTLGAYALTRAVSGVVALRAALLTIPGVLTVVTAGLAAIAIGLASIGSKSGEAAARGIDQLAQQVRSGRTGLADAEKEARQRAAEEAYRIATTQPEGILALKQFGRAAFEDVVAREQARLEADYLGRVRDAGTGRGRGRSDVLQARAGEEDPRATIRRLEAAVLRAGGGPEERTADAATGILKLLHELAARFPFAKQDNRDRPDMGA